MYNLKVNRALSLKVEKHIHEIRYSSSNVRIIFQIFRTHIVLPEHINGTTDIVGKYDLRLIVKQSEARIKTL